MTQQNFNIALTNGGSCGDTRDIQAFLVQFNGEEVLG